MRDRCFGFYRPRWDLASRCEYEQGHAGPHGPMAVARRTDPLTSHLAAGSIPSERIRSSQREVLELLADGMACDERIAQRAQESGVRQSRSGLRTRRAELVTLGQVVDSGERVTLQSGRLSIVWRLAESQRVDV